MEIKKCPPGVAKGAHFQRWQFDHDSASEEPAHPRRAARLAHGELSQGEEAVLTTVLHHPGPVNQRELDAIMAERLGMSHSQVYNAAQRLAEKGSICRMKVRQDLAILEIGFASAQKSTPYQLSLNRPMACP
jgi:hypothetical protein